MRESNRGWATTYLGSVGDGWAAAATRGYDPAPRPAGTVAEPPPAEWPRSATAPSADRST